VQIHFEPAQRKHSLAPGGLHVFEHPSTSFSNELAESGHFRIPGRRLGRLVAERRVPLLYRTGIANPQVRESMFHVEHSPVHPTATPEASLLNKLVHARVDDLHREGLRQLCQ
jgi:hypothetical protein